MKKLLVFAVAALTLAACTQERNIVLADPGLTTITASHASTRSALLASDGETLYNILWDAPDKIMVGYAGTELATFTSKNESPAAEASFTGKLPEGSEVLYGIYPAEEGNSVEADGTYKIILHNEQTAVEGSYDPMAFPAIAQSESKNLSFMNVFGLLELTVGYDDVTSLFFGVKMSESEVNPRPLTRKTADPLVINVQMKDGAPQITSIDGENETGGFVLSPPKGSECFTIDTPYYLAVHPIGGWLQGMYPTFWLTHSDGAVTEIVLDSQPLLERSKVHKVKRLFLEEDSPDVPSIDSGNEDDEVAAITMQQLRDDLEEFAPSNLEDLSYGSANSSQYYSTSAGHNKKVNVLLPPNYDTRKEYPVLFVLHGIFGDENSMLDGSMGVEKMIANAIAEGKTKDMIVIFPQMYTCPTADQPAGFSFDQQTMRYYDKFEDDILEDLLPWAKEMFSIAEGRKNTAITGFSLGGRESLYIGTQHTDVFGFVGAACPAPGILPANDQFMVHEGTIKNEADFRLKDGNPKPYILLISGGTNDGTVGNYPERYHNILTNNNVDHVWHSISDTGHDGSSVQPHLYNFIRHIFNVE